ncbi:MAG: GNAT family N-acetyltransferase [bacterium]|nr:GNAT family N-acetyltransferase [bacterium]
MVYRYTSKKGNTALVRPVRKDDLDNLLAFANNLIAEDTFVMLSGTPISRNDEEKYLRDSLKDVREGKKIHLIAEINGQFAGSGEVRIGDKRKRHVGEIGISLDKHFREEGIGTILLNVLIDESRKRGLTLLYLHCFETNARAIHVYEKLGFMNAGTVPGMYAYKGGSIGEVTMYLPLAA